MSKIYFHFIDNGDIDLITPNLEDILEMIKADLEDIEEGESDREYSITPIWLTDDEFENLPEAQ